MWTKTVCRWVHRKTKRMTINYRVARTFVKLTDLGLEGFAGGVIESLTGNASYPALPVTLADMGTALLAFHDAVLAAMDGGKLLNATKNAKRLVLINILRQTASYVQCVASQDLEVLLSSGFAAASTNRTRSPLTKANIAKLDNSISAQLELRVEPQVNAKAVEVQIKNGTGGWLLGGVFGYARGIVLPGLVSGQSYSVQVRTIGGSTGQSPWSDALTRVVT